MSIFEFAVRQVYLGRTRSLDDLTAIFEIRIDNSEAASLMVGGLARHETFKGSGRMYTVFGRGDVVAQTSSPVESIWGLPKFGGYDTLILENELESSLDLVFDQKRERWRDLNTMLSKFPWVHSITELSPTRISFSTDEQPGYGTQDGFGGFRYHTFNENGETPFATDREAELASVIESADFLATWSSVYDTVVL